MNEKFNKNEKVEKFNNMLGIAVRLSLLILNFLPQPYTPKFGI